MEIDLSENRKSFFGVTMTDFNPVDEIGSVMCCQDGDTFIAVSLTGLNQAIPQGSPFFASGDSLNEENSRWMVNLEQPGHRWLVFDRKYMDGHYVLKVNDGVRTEFSDNKPINDEMIPSSLSYKKFRKNMINFRIISSEIQREDLKEVQPNKPPKYIVGKAYHFYFRKQIVSFLTSLWYSRIVIQQKLNPKQTTKAQKTTTKRKNNVGSKRDVDSDKKANGAHNKTTDVSMKTVETAEKQKAIAEEFFNVSSDDEEVSSYNAY